MDLSPDNPLFTTPLYMQKLDGSDGGSYHAGIGYSVPVDPYGDPLSRITAPLPFSVFE